MNATALRNEDGSGDETGVDARPAETEDQNNSEPEEVRVEYERWAGSVAEQRRELPRLAIGIVIFLAVFLPIGVWIGLTLAKSMGM